MKKNLFFQEIYAVVISLIVTSLIVICSSGIFAAINDIHIKGDRIIPQSLVIKNNSVLYSTNNMTNIDLQDLLLTLKSDGVVFDYNGIDYIWSVII